jgi:hypothetical protein
VPTISFKVSADEAQRLRRKARADNTTVSDYLRKAALGDSTPPRRKLSIKPHPVSGLPFDAGADSAPIVTRDEIAAVLADFP